MNKKDIKEFEMKEEDGNLYIRLPENLYDDNWKLYKNGLFELKEGVTILVGCNGYGKSTTMQEFKSVIENSGYEVVSYDNYRDGGTKSSGDAIFFGNIELAASIMAGSEGEGILSNLSYRMAGKIGHYVREFNQDKLFVFIDAIDGLSINSIIDLKEQLFKLAMKDAKKRNKKLYIFVSANDYEFANGEQCLDVCANKYIRFKDYEEYKKFIIKSHKIKLKRYKEEK